MGDLSNTTINGVSYDFKDAGAARQSHSHTKSQITDFPTSMPASDVPAWAKASSKPSYTASEVGAIATTAKGAASGVAELDSNGKVPSSQLPSFVDDVLEYSAKSSFPATGETGKIYVDTTTNKTYRWSGSAYVEISESLALGETSSTAYRGDRGKAAYDHSQTTSGNPHNVTKSDVGLGNVGNFKAVSTVASQGLSDTEKANARANIGAGTSSFSGSYNDLSNKPTSLPASDVYSWAKASSKPSYTQDEIGDGSTYKRVTSTEKTTWNNKGTYSKPSGGIPKTDLASAVQTSLGLADTSLQHSTVTGSPNLNNYTTTGVYHIATQTATNAPTTNHATLFVDATVGTPYQIFKPDSSDTVWYTRHRSGSTWSAWVAMKFTDTTYSAVTTSAAGLMSADDKTKLNGIATGAQVNSITGVKGNAESSYRTGNVNLTPANIGAAAASDVSVSEISPGDFFTPYSTGEIQSSTPLCKYGKRIFGLIKVKVMSSTPILGNVKTPYLPAIDGAYGIEYVLNIDNDVLDPTPYSIRKADGRMLGMGSWQAGSTVYFYVDYVIA